MGVKKYLWLAAMYVAVVGVTLSVVWAGSQTVTVMAQRAPVQREHTVVIDAGHGGEDGGAVSCTGIPEKQINLEVALRLNDLFHLLGFRTRMIRTTDISVYTAGENLAQKKVSDLKERVRIVAAEEDPVLVSIHQNLFSDARYAGAQVFYGASDSSRALAQAVQNGFRDTLNSRSRREAKAGEGIYLLERADCPAVLVECGFLSNPEEEAKLRTPEYQRRICCVIAGTVAEFLDGQT